MPSLVTFSMYFANNKAKFTIKKLLLISTCENQMLPK